MAISKGDMALARKYIARVIQMADNEHFYYTNVDGKYIYIKFRMNEKNFIIREDGDLVTIFLDLSSMDLRLTDIYYYKVNTEYHYDPEKESWITGIREKYISDVPLVSFNKYTRVFYDYEHLDVVAVERKMSNKNYPCIDDMRSIYRSFDISRTKHYFERYMMMGLRVKLDDGSEI